VMEVEGMDEQSGFRANIGTIGCFLCTVSNSTETQRTKLGNAGSVC
jgi:hypothetical protein